MKTFSKIVGFLGMFAGLYLLFNFDFQVAIGVIAVMAGHMGMED